MLACGVFTWQGLLLALNWLVIPSFAVKFSCVTWNVNGVSKLRDFVFSTSWLGDYDVIFLQETYSTTDDNVIQLSGYLGHHSLAAYTGRRPSRGVSSLFRIESFVDGALQRITTPFDWVVASRWAAAQQPGLTFINVYLPVHTRGKDTNRKLVAQTDLNVFRDFVADLISSNPGDSFLMGGDMNFDPWRSELARINRIPIPPLQRCVYACDLFLSFSFIKIRHAATIVPYMINA
jgi:exonuclease III